MPENRQNLRKEVIAPPAAPAPEFFRPNEFDLGVFGTYATGVGSGENAGALQAWGGGLDLTYWLPWKYAGVRFQGTGASISEGGGNRTQKADGQFVDDPYVTVVPGFTPVLVSGGNGAETVGYNGWFDRPVVGTSPKESAVGLSRI